MLKLGWPWAAPRGALIGASGVILVALSGLVVRFVWQNRPTVVDTWWHDLMAAQNNGAVDVTARFLNSFGGTVSMSLVTAVIVGVLLVAKKWRESIIIGLTVVLASGVSTVLKILIARPRPIDGVVGVGLDSFPSGHTTVAAALMVALAFAFPRVWTWAVAGIWITSMALSRTYLLVHWISDVLAAAVLGASMALLVSALFTSVHAGRHSAGSSLKMSVRERSSS
ncbi:Phosphoesterase, PA-phosphatase-like protein [marine actinobacterium PHSC20C1]|nr:Phosphoesterase, PA-phosphatase-like protein [marine actinobacterium PHSC20C1]